MNKEQIKEFRMSKQLELPFIDYWPISGWADQHSYWMHNGSMDGDLMLEFHPDYTKGASYADEALKYFMNR